MIDKLKFNNLVISNKKGIEQSRIQTINKLVHKIRRLKTLLEKKPENIKCKDRIRKSTETMEILKKMKRIDVVKRVLLLDKPAPAIITNGAATPEELAVSLISMNRVMQSLIKIFKTELLLREGENDEWKESLMEASKRRRKIERTEEKRRKRLELKQQKVIGRKRQEWLKENQNNREETDFNAATTSGMWLIEELSNNITEEIEEVPNNDSKIHMKKNSNNKTTSLPNEKLAIKRKKLVEKKDSDRESNTAKENLIISGHPNVHSNVVEENAVESLVVDPFFITDTGENYMSTALIKRDNETAVKNDRHKIDLHMIKPNKRDKKHTDFRFNDRIHQLQDKNHAMGQQNKRNSKDKNDRNKISRNNWNGSKNLYMKQDYQPKKYENMRNENNMHPSWKAKQMFKPIITTFQGKKIKFEDDDEKNEPQEKNIKANNKFNKQKINSSAKDTIHPSWAAKQKFKPIITTFQGKKITFDD